jgi:glycosyltransferase involved in cell wall biosynthesis
MLFSIVIPIYNVEKYVSECIDSVLAQSYKNYEIILVDDGSKDNSGIICDKYSKRYDFIRVIHKKNGGLSDARNVGLKELSGKYVIFLDSDDLWINSSFLENAEKFIQENGDQDVILFQGNKFYEQYNKVVEDRRYNAEIINSSTKDEILKHLINTNSYSMSACTKILLRKSIEKNNLYFKKNLLGEDLDWFLKLIISDCNIVALNEINYLYRIRNGSITQSISEKNLSDGIFTVDSWRNRLMGLNLDPAYKRYYFAILTKAHIVNILTFSKVNTEIKKKYISKLKISNVLLNNWFSKEILLVYIICKIFGIRITSGLMNYYYNYKSKM